MSSMRGLFAGGRRALRPFVGIVARAASRIGPRSAVAAAPPAVKRKTVALILGLVTVRLADDLRCRARDE